MFAYIGRHAIRAATVISLTTAGVLYTTTTNTRFAYCKMVQDINKRLIMAQEIAGKWNLVESDNFDAYMKECGVGMMTRTIASKLKPTLTFVVDGDKWTMTSESTFKTHIVNFELGKELEEKTADGRDVTSTYSVDGNKLVQTEKGKNGKDSKFERFVENGQLVITCECNGVKCVRKYAKA